MIEDENVRQIREARKKLLKEHGGFENYFKYLQKLDREYFAAKSPQRRKPKTTKSKSSGPAVRRPRRSA